MNTETIQLSNGYTAKIATDEGAESPWTLWDTEPPAWVHSDGSMTAYGEPPSVHELYGRLPVELFTDERLQRVKNALGIEDSDNEGYADDEHGWKEALEDYLPSRQDYYGSKEYFDALEGLCGLLDIPFLRKTSTGYVQRQWADCFFMATPEWTEKTGVTKENAPAQLGAAHKLWSAWAWGDVYGVMEITRPDGEECDDAGCWGFYGTDHAESGLLDHAESVVKYDMEAREREEREAFRAACADIATV